MLPTRNSKRLAGKENAASAAKSKRSNLKENVTESRKNLNRGCKQILQSNILKENKFYEVSSKSTKKLSTRLTENNLNSQKQKNIKNVENEIKTLKKLNSNKNVQAEKQNKSKENKTIIPLPLENLDKAKSNKVRKITNDFPLKTISDNVSHAPVWAVCRNPPLKRTKKQSRVSDIYNIDLDEDIMNEPGPVKKKKIAVRKQQTVANKISSKKAILSHTSHKDKISSIKTHKFAGQLNIDKGLTVNNKIATLHTNSSERMLPVKYETFRDVSEFEPMCPIPEPIESISFKAVESTEINKETQDIGEGSVKNNEFSNAVENTVFVSNTKKQVNDEGYVEECINDCCSSFINMDTSIISLRKAVAECLSKSTKSNATPEKFTLQGQNDLNTCAENCIDECYSSFINLDTSLQKSVEKNKTNLIRIEKTPEKSHGHKANSKGNNKLKNSDNVQLFLIPKMTSTPENVDNKDNQPVKQMTNCGLKLSEMSAIPCTVSRNIQFELSEFEISPIKPVSVNKENLAGSPFKENENPKGEQCFSAKKRDRNYLKENNTIEAAKPIQINSVIPKKTAKKTVSSQKYSKGKNNPNLYKMSLFESPEKEETAVRELDNSSPAKKVKKNVFAEEAVSPSMKDIRFMEVLKPVNFYQSPHQAKKHKSRSKKARNDQKKIKDNEDADYQPKKPICRTKAAAVGKQKTKEQNEAENVDELMKNLNQHFSEFEHMDLCIE